MAGRTARRGRREVETVGMSFLDVISCGFGAVILLLVLTMALEPVTAERQTEDLRGLVSAAETEREALIRRSAQLQAELRAKEAALAAIQQRYEALETGWQAAQRTTAAAEARAAAKEKAADQLQSVRQQLSEEMKRLFSQPDYTPPGEDAVVGGIPVDSEYVIFIIDTSGSMKTRAWPLVARKVAEVLRVYPRIKGIQVMNDMGAYMFSTYAGQWIPDTPARRRAVVERIASWTSFSNSSPVEGVVSAIRGFYRSDRRISLYVFGDDFTGRNINKVLEEVAAINRRNDIGAPRVRIHAFGFPVLFENELGRANRTRFAHLMRVLAEQNAGSFVGLNGLN